MRLFGAAVLLLGLAVNVRAEDKSVQSKLVGTWKSVKIDSPKPPPKDVTITVEFTKDGKVTVAFSIKDKELGKLTGTYKANSESLTTTMKDPNDDTVRTVTVTIKELTEKKFVTIEKTGDKTQTIEFEKVK